MAKGVVLCHWVGGKKGGHLGLAVEADAGKTYVTWVPDGESGSSQNLQDDFRVYTGIRDDARNRQIAQALGPLRAGQVRTARLSNAQTKTPTQVQVGSQSYTFNYGQVFKQPDEICEIPAIDATGGTQLGLDVERIYHWWMGFDIGAKNLNFRAQARTQGARSVPWKKVSATRNCCSVVYRALVMGGASYYRSKWFKKFFLTPAEVFTYAEKLRDTLAELNRNQAAVAASAAELSSKLKGLSTGGATVELPTVQQWMTMSHVKAGLLTGKASRKEQIAIIDGALDGYWRAGPWPADGDYDEDAIDTRDTKAKSLCMIIGQAGMHAALKPKSDRRHAVAALLTRGWQVMRQRVVGNPDQRLWGDDAIAKRHDIHAYEAVLSGFSAHTTGDHFA